MVEEIKDRRPIKARETGWAKRSAKWLQLRGATPNGISVFSIGCAALAGIAFFFAFNIHSLLSIVLFLFAALMIQGRLICNLLDGMVAVEGGMRSPVGAIYNDLPDRISDTIILIGVGYGLASYFSAAPSLGWAAALMAILTAYVRVLGGSCGLDQKFSGPMAKQHRMALLTLSAVAACLLSVEWRATLFYIILWVITLGAFITAYRRTYDLIKTLRSQKAE